MDIRVSGILKEDTVVLYGTVNASGSLYGQVGGIVSQLTGEINSSGMLTGTITVANGGGAGYSPYEGEYDITPKVSSQTLATANRLMKKNVTVEEIPYYETANSYGGDTIIIGEEL